MLVFHDYLSLLEAFQIFAEQQIGTVQVLPIPSLLEVSKMSLVSMGLLSRAINNRTLRNFYYSFSMAYRRI